MQDIKERPIFSIRFCKELRKEKGHFGFLATIFIVCTLLATGCAGAIVLIAQSCSAHHPPSFPVLITMFSLVVIGFLFLLFSWAAIYGMSCEISYAWNVAKDERNRRRR